MANLTTTTTPAPQHWSRCKTASCIGQAGPSSTTWIWGIAKTPLRMEITFAEGGGEVWYVVIRGREPGLYRTPQDANAQTDGVPHQFREKKSRCEALASYRENYAAGIAYDYLVGAAAATGVPSLPAINMGVQKWIAVPASTIAAAAQ
ncbi:hypothetical protein C8R45DRAFT_934132 [Mycena sanguinolenta]|nr:hypothetical protein C8R45DRAFT_934132 [Mycena sanguinolenta]